MSEISQTIKRRCRRLRADQTESEELLWQKLRNRKFNNLKFLRQHPIKFHMDNKIYYFIADFYCHEQKLVVELDGEIHKKQKDYDKLRTIMLNDMGIKVVRFGNKQIFNNNRKI